MSKNIGYSLALVALCNISALYCMNQPELDKALFAAAARSNIEKMKELLQQGANPNTTFALFGETPLHAAARNGHLAVVQELIAAGADVNAKTTQENKATPLHSAIYGDGNLDVVKALIEAGADVNTKDGFGVTPIRATALDRHVAIGKELLKHNANVEGTNPAWIQQLKAG